MAKPYPIELRERVVDAWLKGDLTQEEVAKRFSVCSQSVVRWVGRLRATGTAALAAMGGAHRPYQVDPAGAEILCGIIDCLPDSTLPELCSIYLERTGIVVSPQTLSDTVRRLGYTRKRGSSEDGPRPPLRRLRSGRRSSKSRANLTRLNSSSLMKPASTS